MAKIPNKRIGNSCSFSIMIDGNIERAEFTWDELGGRDELPDEEIKQRVMDRHPLLKRGFRDETKHLDPDEIIAGQIVLEIEGCNKDTYISYICNMLGSQRPETAIVVDGEILATVNGKFLKCFKDKSLDECLDMMGANNG